MIVFFFIKATPRNIIKKKVYRASDIASFPRDFDRFKVPGVRLSHGPFPTWRAPLEYRLLVMRWPADRHTLQFLDQIWIGYLKENAKEKKVNRLVYTSLVHKTLSRK